MGYCGRIRQSELMESGLPFGLGPMGCLGDCIRLIPVATESCGQSTHFALCIYLPLILMLRILTRTAATSSKVAQVAPATRCSYAPFGGFLRSTATVAAETSKPSAVDEPAIISSKDMPQLDSELVDPVLKWLLDEQNILETPHIPVKGVHQYLIVSRS